MRRSTQILLAALVLVGLIPGVSRAFTNPLQKYNLYDDTHGNGPGRQGIMSEAFYNIPGSDSQASTYNPAANSVPSTAKIGKSATKTQNEKVDSTNTMQRRNDYLRDSSKKRFSKVAPAWLTDVSFYSEPSLESIKAKYKASDFAGCMQEATSYVRVHPNDTLGYYYLAMSYVKTGDGENAVAAYEKVISLNDNPMIVKYATNGRNCVLNPSSEKCYPNVNVPEYRYPYADIANGVDLTPVDPQTLINRNVGALQTKLSPSGSANASNGAAGGIINALNNNGNNANNNEKIDGRTYPFNVQDASLDKFVNSPYGSGFSPELEKEYKQMKLKELQQNLNNSENGAEGVKKFEESMKF